MLTTYGLSGTLNVDYGDTLPQTGTEGQIFFQISDPYYELPPNGTTGEFLRGDGTWSNTIIKPSGGSREFRAERGERAVWLGFGSGDINHGLYSDSKNAWMVYCDSNNNVHLNGNASTADKLKNLTLDNSTLNSTAGSFAFSGSGEPWAGSDWVGLQIGDDLDKFQIHAKDATTLQYRQNDTGGTNSASWGNWVDLLSSGNYTSYTVTKTGSGASGTWGISITGNAATATKATQDGSGNTITSTYVKKAGDTMSGKLSIINNSTSTSPSNSNIELREYNTLSNTGTHSAAYAPRLGFHWGNRYWCQFALFDSRLRLYNGDLSGYFPFQASAVYGAVWNDYAEMRNVPEANIFEEKENIRNIKLAGRCVCEVGDDTMTLSTERMQPGCKVISDTFGFNIGETENCKTPIAVSGRALVYIYEGREAAKQHIGQPVCSGPDGTISIMTDEEYRDKGYCCVGTISAVPEYETWGSGNIQVNGRIWIYVK